MCVCDEGGSPVEILALLAELSEQHICVEAFSVLYSSTGLPLRYEEVSTPHYYCSPASPRPSGLSFRAGMQGR